MGINRSMFVPNDTKLTEVDGCMDRWREGRRERERGEGGMGGERWRCRVINGRGMEGENSILT